MARKPDIDVPALDCAPYIFHSPDSVARYVEPVAVLELFQIGGDRSARGHFTGRRQTYLFRLALKGPVIVDALSKAEKIAAPAAALSAIAITGNLKYRRVLPIDGFLFRENTLLPFKKNAQGNYREKRDKSP